MLITLGLISVSLPYGDFNYFRKVCRKVIKCVYRKDYIVENLSKGLGWRKL